MLNFDDYLTEVRCNCQYVSVRRLRSCKADMLEYTPYHGYDVTLLRSYYTNVCIKIGNLYLVADKHCTATTWQHVNKFIQDTRTHSKGTIICYMDDMRSDKVYLKYLYNHTTVTFKYNEIAGLIEPFSLSEMYLKLASALRANLQLLNYGRAMTPSDFDIIWEEVNEWFGL